DALNQLYATLLARLPVINAVLKGMEAGAAFGPVGMAVGAVIALAMESGSVAHGFRMVNEVLGALANAVGMLLEPILPLIEVLRAVLVPVFTVLGTVLEAVLLPIMPFVFEALKILGIAILFVAEVFQRVRGFILNAVGGLVHGIGQFIDSLLGWITSLGRDLKKSGQSMMQSAQAAFESAAELAEARRDLIGLTYEEAMARAKNTQALERATEAMRNVPPIFKAALVRGQVAAPTGPGLMTTQAAAQVGSSQSPGSHVVQVTVDMSGA